ncbi:MAG: hypothetical protein WBX22_06495 [Silvibacterium sp.]
MEKLTLFNEFRHFIWLIGLAFTLVHIASSGRYGFQRNELLTYSNALHLDWC